jgi:cation diffusion facilitator family transporter
VNSNSKDKTGYWQGAISVIGNLLLFALKFWAGLTVGSVALIADAWHTLSDSVSSIIVIVGIGIASRKPTRRHPFGFGRVQQIAAIFMAFLLAGVGIELIREAIQKTEGEYTHFGTLAIVVTVISIVAKESLAQYAFWCYRKTGFETLRADAWHHRSDAISSVIILIGIFLRPYIEWIDSLLGIIVSLLLIYAAYIIVRDSIKKLLGEEPPPDLIDRINKIVGDTHQGNLSPHHFHLHNYGDHHELTFHIRVPNATSVESAHRLASVIEARVLSELLIDCTIHIEPLVCEHIYYGD